MASAEHRHGEVGHDGRSGGGPPALHGEGPGEHTLQDGQRHEHGLQLLDELHEDELHEDELQPPAEPRHHGERRDDGHQIQESRELQSRDSEVRDELLLQDGPLPKDGPQLRAVTSPMRQAVAPWPWQPPSFITESPTVPACPGLATKSPGPSWLRASRSQATPTGTT